MMRYLVTKPQWITSYLSSPSQFLMLPQHCIILNTVVKELNNLQTEETSPDKIKNLIISKELEQWRF